MPKRIAFTIGHSTRSLDELVDILKRAGVERLIDVRTVPRSRHNPQFNREALERDLPERGIAYEHRKELGGLRRGLKDASPNRGWRNESFRNYADYMQTDDFREALESLIETARRERTAVMCAEAVPWRCHRSLIADALLVRGMTVRQFMGAGKSHDHDLTSFARVDGDRITYPA